MALNSSTILRRCLYNFTSGNAANILKGEPFPIGGHAAFTIMIKFSGLAAGSSCKIYLQLSNNGNDWANSGDEVSVTNAASVYMLIPAKPNGAAAAVYARIGIKDILDAGIVQEATFAGS